MKKFVLLLSIGLTLDACNTNELEFDNLEVQPINGVFGVPLGEITYTLRELLDEANIEDEALQEDTATSLLSLTYTDELTYSNQDDFIIIDDVTGEGTYQNTATFANNLTVPQDFSIPFLPYNQVYDPQDGQRLDSVFHDGGQITVTATSDANVESVLFVLEFQNTQDVATRSATRLSGMIGRPASPGEVATGEATIDLADRVTLLASSSATNDFIVSFAATFTLSPGDELTGTESLTFDFTYENQTFSVIYGKFGQSSAEVGNETLEFNFFDDLGDEV